ncbi:MAG TPA: GNAT family N-acetyltransferase [Gaiellaceae bacterium]|jgi:GNAT superfamily N-acetyltransferase
MNSRPATTEDFGAMLAVLVADEEHYHDRPSQLTVGDLREWLSRTELATDSWLYEESGELCAFGWCDFVSDNALALGIGIVHPGWKGKGLGRQLLDRSEDRARMRAAKRMHQIAIGPDQAAHRLLAGRGYREVRRFYEMAVQLESEPDVPDMGIEMLDPDDLREFHDALDEAFRDHWEHHPSTFDEWWGRHAGNPNLDLSLWFVIREADEMVAVVRNEANRNGGGYVGAIGVRRPWRGKGYAKGLLLHTFRAFYDRGIKRVTLGVDAESPTGATHLYERVGMHVEQQNVVFEKSLT